MTYLPDRKSSRRTVIYLGASILIGLLAQAVPAADQDKSARSVIDRHLEAVGGPKLVEGHPHRTYRGTLEVQGLTGSFDVRKSDGKLLFQLELEGIGTVLQGYDGEVGWELGQGGERLLDGRDLEQVAAQAHPHEELKPAELYPVAEFLGTETIDSTVYDRVQLVRPSGTVLHEYYERETGLRRRSVTLTDEGEPAVTLMFDDYREFEGHLIATRLTQEAGGQTILRVVESVSFEPVDAAVFALPEPVEQLVAP